MKNTKTFLPLLFLFLGLFACAQTKVAIIKDADGFVNVRSGQGREFEVVTTIDTDDFFYSEESDDEWLKVTVLQYNKGNWLQGYMHKSRIQLVEKMPLTKQKKLISSVLKERKKRADRYTNSSLSERIELSKQQAQPENYTDLVYNPVLEVLPHYFCTTKDGELLNQFFATLWADSGSASEMPAYAIGQCFACETEIVTKELAKLPLEQKKNVIAQIYFGLINIFSVDNNGHSDNPEYSELVKRLETVR